MSSSTVEGQQNLALAFGLGVGGGILGTILFTVGVVKYIEYTTSKEMKKRFEADRKIYEEMERRKKEEAEAEVKPPDETTSTTSITIRHQRNDFDPELLRQRGPVLDDDEVVVMQSPAPFGTTG